MKKGLSRMKNIITKMKILILGYSDIVKRKILPEINSSKDITKLSALLKVLSLILVRNF